MSSSYSPSPSSVQTRIHSPGFFRRFEVGPTLSNRPVSQSTNWSTNTSMNKVSYRIYFCHGTKLNYYDNEHHYL
jgi:hypothetical protein